MKSHKTLYWIIAYPLFFLSLYAIGSFSSHIAKLFASDYELQGGYSNHRITTLEYLTFTLYGIILSSIPLYILSFVLPVNTYKAAKIHGYILFFFAGGTFLLMFLKSGKLYSNLDTLLLGFAIGCLVVIFTTKIKANNQSV